MHVKLGARPAQSVKVVIMAAALECFDEVKFHDAIKMACRTIFSIEGFSKLSQLLLIL